MVACQGVSCGWLRESRLWGLIKPNSCWFVLVEQSEGWSWERAVRKDVFRSAKKWESSSLPWDQQHIACGKCIYLGTLIKPGNDLLWNTIRKRWLPQKARIRRVSRRNMARCWGWKRPKLCWRLNEACWNSIETDLRLIYLSLRPRITKSVLPVNMMQNANLPVEMTRTETVRRANKIILLYESVHHDSVVFFPLCL